jgi:hypothetical protein
MAAFTRIDGLHYIGLSTDTKPTSCNVGAHAIEYDTKRWFITPDGGSTWAVEKNSATPAKGVAYTFKITLRDKTTGEILADPTLVAGDFKISKDDGGYANLTTLPSALPALGYSIKVSLSATEMNANDVHIVALDADAGQWVGDAWNIQPS